jgi:hypothetical protein
MGAARNMTAAASRPKGSVLPSSLRVRPIEPRTPFLPIWQKRGKAADWSERMGVQLVSMTRYAML